MNNKSIYINGLQRSGTNYLEQLLKVNFRISKLNNSLRNGDMWKHSTGVSNAVKASGAPIFIIHKNPYLWIESICFRRSVDWKTTQTDFPATTLNSDPDYNVGNEKLNIENLALTYKMFYENWLTKADKNIKNRVIKIKYEDLLTDEKRVKVLSEVGDKLHWKSPMQWTNPIKVGMSPSWNDNDKSMYLDQTPVYLTNKQVKLVTKTLTMGLISTLGYDIL